MLEFFVNYKMNGSIEQLEGDYSFGFSYDKLTDIVANKEKAVEKLKEYLEKYWYVGHKNMGQPLFPSQPGTGTAQQQAAPVPVIGFRILQRIKHVRVPPSKPRMKQAVIGIHEIMGRHRNAVAPHGVLPQGKTPLIRLRTMRPRLRHSGMKNGVIPGIPAQQPLHDGIDHLEIGNGSGDVGVKALGLRIIAHDEHPCLLRPFHARARIASGEQKHHTEHHE